MTLSVDIKYKSNNQIASLKSECSFPFVNPFLRDITFLRDLPRLLPRPPHTRETACFSFTNAASSSSFVCQYSEASKQVDLRVETGSC